jgi:iron(III) transport system ATP-binding protein
MKPAIELHNVTLRYGNSPVLEGLSLSVRQGEVLTLLGPSGCGKSTVLRLILGFMAPAQGRVCLDGDVVSCDGRVLQPPEARRLAVVFQDLALWPHLTVQGNLAFGLEAQKIPAQERKQRIVHMLGRVGLIDKAIRYPGELSGGERQRVAIARALVLEPRAVLMDEPLANVDVALKQELLELFREVLRERKVTTLYVSHDLSEATALGDCVAVLEAGRLVQQGSLDDLRSAPASPFVQALVNNAAWKNIRAE